MRHNSSKGPRIASWAAALMGAILLSWEARTNPVDAFGLGARPASMGGAHAAVATDFSANYYNPAGLVRGSDLEIDVGYQYAGARLRLNGRDIGVDDSRGLTAGLVAPGKIGAVKFAFGVALFLPDERVSRVRAVPRTQPRFIYYDNRTQRIYLATNLAFRIIDGLYIGGGLTFMSRTKGNVVLKGFIDIAPDIDNVDHTDLRGDIDVDLKALRYPQFGVLWEINSRWALGLTYRHHFNLELKQRFRIQGDAGFSPDSLLIEDGFYEIVSLSSNLYQPMQVVLGLSGRLHERVLVALDLTFNRWSQFKNPGSRLQLGYDLGTFNDYIHLTSQGPPPSPRFNDTLSLRFGMEGEVPLHRKVTVVLRCGYFFDPSPAPEQTTQLMNLADNDKHGLSFGAGVKISNVTAVFPRPIHLDLQFGYIHLARRRHLKWSADDPVGDFVSSGYLLSVGVTLRLLFYTMSH